MNIVYCGDNQMTNGLTISVLSLIKHTRSQLNIFIVTADYQVNNHHYKSIDQHSISKLDHLVKTVNQNSHVIQIDISEIFTRNLPVANLQTIFTPNCMLRLYLDLIPQLPSKLLYLDTDIICHQDFTELYNQDIDGHELLGVLDHYGKWVFHNQLHTFDYINSGMLLLNMTEIKKTGLFQRCREMCTEHKMFMPDQSAINKLSQSKLIVDHRFNEQHKLNNDTVFQHFTTSFRFYPWIHTQTVKPWQIDEVHQTLNIHEYDDLFAEYKKLNV